MNSFKIGDHVVFSNESFPKWVGSEYIITGNPLTHTFGTELIKHSEYTKEMGYSLGQTLSMCKEYFSLAELQYDPSQQMDLETDV